MSRIRLRCLLAAGQLAQSCDAKSGKIELPNKLGAMQLLAKMCGWNEPEKHEFEHGFKERQELVESSHGFEEGGSTQRSARWIAPAIGGVECWWQPTV